jgi:hypothetical protein
MANKDSGVVNIHGKEYQTVALRVKNFREKHSAYSLTTEIVSRDAECVVMRAVISDDQGRVISTGHSEERRGSTQINKTSALENAETSAIGRALAAFGLGGTEFATADEVANAIGQQKASTKSVTLDVWDSMTPEAQTWLQGIADCVRAELESKGGEAAMALLTEQDLEADHKVAIWSRFDSKERSAMEPHKRKKAA